MVDVRFAVAVLRFLLCESLRVRNMWRAIGTEGPCISRGSSSFDSSIDT